MTRGGSDSGEEGAVRGDESVGHPGGVKGKAGIAVAVEEDESTGGVCALGEKMDSFACREIGGGSPARKGWGRGPTKERTPGKKDGGVGAGPLHECAARTGVGGG